MKKIILISFLLLMVKSAFSQLVLEDSDFNKLVLVGEYYSKNVMLSKESAVDDLEKFRSEKLSQIIDVLQTKARVSIDILDEKYLYKPSYDDLVMWYVIREIHYNLTDKENSPKPSSEVAKTVLSQKIDERWLLDNYYYRIQSTVAMLFNTEDFSKINFDLSTYGLENELERAVLYFNLLDAFTTRFKVLQYMKKNDKLLEYADKMPTFNDRKYFYYTDFQYQDFEWIGHNKVEMYNQRHIGSLYATLATHLNAVGEIMGAKGAQELFWNSILSKPEYFHHSNAERDLKKIYKSAKKKR